MLIAGQHDPRWLHQIDPKVESLIRDTSGNIIAYSAFNTGSAGVIERISNCRWRSDRSGSGIWVRTLRH
jgi:hypothetical protein